MERHNSGTNEIQKQHLWNVLNEVFSVHAGDVALIQSAHRNIPDVAVLSTHTDMDEDYYLILFREYWKGQDSITITYKEKGGYDDDEDAGLWDNSFVIAQDGQGHLRAHLGNRPNAEIPTVGLEDIRADIGRAAVAWRHHNSGVEASAYEVPDDIPYWLFTD